LFPCVDVITRSTSHLTNRGSCYRDFKIATLLSESPLHDTSAYRTSSCMRYYYLISQLSNTQALFSRHQSCNTRSTPPHHENKHLPCLFKTRHRPANHNNLTGCWKSETDIISTRESETFGSLVGFSLFLFFVAGVLRGWLWLFLGIAWYVFCRTWSLWDGEVGGTGRLEDGKMHGMRM
jgi:hypothetical protein